MVSDKEIENNEEYAAGHKAGKSGDVFRDAAQTLTDTDSIWDKGYEEGSSTRDGLCFLTTACTQARGLPDNCLELTTLRRFRDDVLMSDSKGRKAVKEYYHIAPTIVTAINASPNQTDVWNNVYKEVKKAVSLVQSRDFNAAFEHYREMVNTLKGKF